MENSQSSHQQLGDSLTYAMAQNGKNSPLYRIPEELLAMIVKSLDDDEVTRLVLGQVSSRLRRHVHSKIAPSTRRASRLGGPDENEQFLDHLKECYDSIKLGSEKQVNQLRYLLRMDRLCRDCIQHSDLVLASTREPATSRPDPSPPASAASVPAPAIVRSEAPFEVIQAKGKLWTGCKFTCADKANTLYCSGCDIEHSARAFSKTQTEMASEIRICIGREGVLQLCEHRHIKWADIEAHFLRQQDPESRNQLVATACELTCEHESHCTGPKRTNASMPRLHVSGSSRSRYDINWFWTAHHILNLDANYQMNADQVREAFQEDLRTVAGVMLTGTRNGDALNRAMSCFGKRWCTCFHHGEAKQSPTEESSAQTHCLFKRRALLNGQQHSSNIKSNTCYRRYRAEHIHVEPCKDSCVDHSEKRKACFSVKYSRSMGGTWMFMPQLPSLSNREGPLRPAVPPHEWLHALEPTSYELNDDTETVGEVWPVCRDMTCGNHYASYQTTHCSEGEDPKHLYPEEVDMDEFSEM